MTIKSVQSKNPCPAGRQVCKSLPFWQAGVIHARYDILKAHDGVLKSIGIKVQSKEGNDFSAGEAETKFTFIYP